MRRDKQEFDKGRLTFVDKDPEDPHDVCISRKQPVGTPVLQELPSEYTGLGIVAYLQPTSQKCPKHPGASQTLNNPGKFMIFIEVDELLVRIQRRCSKGGISFSAEGNIREIET